MSKKDGTNYILYVELIQRHMILLHFSFRMRFDFFRVEKNAKKSYYYVEIRYGNRVHQQRIP